MGPGESSEHLVRATRRLAAGLGAEWIALYVETPELQRLPEGERDRILRSLRLAEDLGARSVTVGGGSVAAEVVGYARAQNVSKIVLGKPRRRGGLRRLASSTVDRVMQGARDIDVEIIGTEARPRRWLSETLRRSSIAAARTLAWSSARAATRSAGPGMPPQ